MKLLKYSAAVVALGIFASPAFADYDRTMG